MMVINKSIGWGVIILFIGFVAGMLAYSSFFDVEKINKPTLDSELKKDSLHNIVKLYELKNDSILKENNIAIRKVDSLNKLISINKRNNEVIRNKIMEGDSDSAYSIIKQHLPDSAR